MALCKRALLIAAILLIWTNSVWSADEEAKAPTRPAFQSNRWQEDWSPLRDPMLRTQPYDYLKYISLSPVSYLSLGLTLRERFESVGDPAFGLSKFPSDGYLLQRLQPHADLHFNEDWRFFIELEDVRAFDKKVLGNADQNPLDLRLAFLEYTHKFDCGRLKGRIGRQEFAFDLQRFVSLRDGPNVRQAFDAIWLDWESEPWRLIGFVSQPVQYFRYRPFDDRSEGNFQFHTLRVERHVLGKNELSGYYSLFYHQNASYLFASGNEYRNIFDMRFAGSELGFDWDMEAMGQLGTIGGKKIRAWAFGSRTGYTFSDYAFQPRIGIQIDAASGDRHPNGNIFQTFNPLFPNGYYFTLAGLTGYSNLINVKPTYTFKFTEKATILTAVGFQWRMTTADAVYVFPVQPVAGTAGVPGPWTAVYGQFRLDWIIENNLLAAVEIVHYEIGKALQKAGGRNANYLGCELKFYW